MPAILCWMLKCHRTGRIAFRTLGLGAKKFRRTRLRYHGGLATGFEKIPRSVRLLMIERVVAHGITLTRSSEATLADPPSVPACFRPRRSGPGPGDHRDRGRVACGRRRVGVGHLDV